MPEADPGYGPPPGQPNGPARGGGIPLDALAKSYTSGFTPDTTDPAWDRLRTDPTDDNTRARAKLIHRDLPLVTIQNTWSHPAGARGDLSHLIGSSTRAGCCAI